MQGRIPIAYLSKALGPKSLGLSTYEKRRTFLLYSRQSKNGDTTSAVPPFS